MKRLLMAVIFTAILADPSHAQTCPAGKITCEQWCPKYGSKAYQEGCLRACATYGGLRACVRDRNWCATGHIECRAWCKQYRSPSLQETCLRTHPTSCMNKHGSLQACVPSGPPAPGT